MPRLFLFALALYLVLCLAVPGFQPNNLVGGDGPFYAQTARNLLTSGTYQYDPRDIWGLTVWRPPGYSLWIALWGAQLVLVRCAQLALHVLTAAGIWQLGRRLQLPEPASRLAGLAWLVYLPALQATQGYLSDGFAAAPVVGVALFTLRLKSEPSRWGTAALGLLLGYAALVRPQLLLLAVLPLGLLPRRRLALALVGTVLTLAPWLIYTTRLTGTPSLGLTGLVGWVSAVQYQGRYSYAWTKSDWRDLATEWDRGLRTQLARTDPPDPLRAEMAADREWGQEARRVLTSIPPQQFLAHVPRRIYWLWSNADFGVWTPWRPWWVALRLQWVLYTLLALIGAWPLRRLWMLWLPGVALTLGHLWMPVEPRYSVPLRSLLCLLVGVGALTIGQWLARTLPAIGRRPWAKTLGLVPEEADHACAGGACRTSKGSLERAWL